MKRLKNLFFALALCAPLTVVAQDIEINAENFPDENFRNYLLKQRYGTDGMITEAEIKGVTYIDVDRKSISNLKGIEHFTALTELYCSYNQLTVLDVSNNTALKSLYCYNNQFTALDVSKNTALTILSCASNQLTALDVSKNTALIELSCGGNPLTALDVSNNTALKILSCGACKLTELDVSKNTALTSIVCSSNQLTTLDVSNNTALRTLGCYNNQIKGEGMDALISSLPQNETSYTCDLLVYYDDGNDGNICTKSQVAAAKAKGWTIYYYDYWWSRHEYEGVDDETTAIALPVLKTDAEAIYTLHGQKVTTPQKGGIYIVNGKKVVVK